MIKHVNLWKFRESLSPEEKDSVRQGMKEAFEAPIKEGDYTTWTNSMQET